MKCPVVLILALTAVVAFAQTESARISGRVTDLTGAVIVGAECKITNLETNASTITTTNDDGIYVIPDLRPARYRLSIQKAGFHTVVQPSLQLYVQDAVNENFTLAIGPTSDSVTVTGDTAGLQTDSAAVSTVVNQQFVENMPLNGRSFQSLIYAIPGVLIAQTDPWLQTQFSTNGQRTDTNYFTIDGVSANFGASPVNGGRGNGVGETLGGTTPALTTGGGTNALVSVDAMQEFRIQTSSYAPEFGRSPGAQVSIVTKSGSNKWHGTASEYLRNDVFDARNYFNNAGPSQDIYGNPIPAEPKPPLRQNDFGGTFSGALWKDRTFFFFSYEVLRLRQPNNIRAYFFSTDAKAAVTSAWKPIVDATPTGTGALYNPACDNITIPCLRQLNVGYSDPSSFDSYSLRLDQKLTDKINLFARYSHAPSNSDMLQELNQNLVLYGNTDTATLGVTATIAPSLVNDFRGNWSRQVSGNTVAFAANYGAVAPPASIVVPPAFASGNVSYAFSLPGAGAVGFGLGSEGMDNTHQLNFVDTVSKTVGTHQLKFGVDFRRPSTFEHPTSTFIGIPTAWSELLNGTMLEQLNLSAVPLTIHLHNWSFFGQDTWKATPRLTLTYGLRWDINTSPVSDTAGQPLYTLDGVFNSNPLALVPKPLFNTYYGAFAPRVGAAYQVNPKTTVRAGFGLFYDLPYGGGLSYALAEPPYYAEQFFFGYVNVNDFTNPAYQQLPHTTDLSQLSGQTLTAVNPNLKPPLTYQWNVALERQLGQAQTLTVTYLGARGHNLLYDAGIRLSPQDYGLFDNANLNAGSSRYNALQVQLMRRMSHGLQAMVSYSYSHSNDTISQDYTGDTFTSISALKLPPLTRSDFDFHQTFKAMVSYEIPKPAWEGKARKAVFGGWALDGLLLTQSAPPLTVIINEVDPVRGLVSAIAAEVPERPIWIHDPTQPAGKALNPAAFRLSADGSSAVGLRNSIQSPYGIVQTDMALRRRFNITERVKLDFRAEYFNIFNHPMFGGSLAPSTYLGQCSTNNAATCTGSNWSPNSYFGKVYYSGGGASVGGQTLNAGLGSQSALYAPGGNRSGQLTIRLTF